MIAYGNVMLSKNNRESNMTKMHFVSAHFGGNAPWFHQISSKTIEITNSYYTDENTPSRHLAMHPRFKSKIPKMLEWQYIDADWYVWIDSSLKLKKNDIDLAESILDATKNKPFCLFKHTAANSILEEGKRVLDSMNNNHNYLIKRYTGEAIRKQIIHYYGDPEFKDNKLFASGFFAYNKKAIPMLNNWFEQVIHWSLQCQISLPYVLQKSGLEYSLFEGTIQDNRYFTWDWKSREQNLKY